MTAAPYDVVIDGRTYCANGWGGAVAVEVRDDLGNLVALDVERVTYANGGVWDGFDRPWFTPTANPATVSARWGGTRLPDQVTPYVATLRVWLAVEDGLGPGVWSYAQVYAGVVTGLAFTPAPGGGGALVVEATDYTTQLADATVNVAMGEHVARDRLDVLLSGRKALGVELTPTASTPGFERVVGVIQPEQAVTILEHAVDVATAAAQALIVHPSTSDVDLPRRNVAFNVPIRSLGREARDGTVWGIVVDPDNPVDNPVAGAAMKVVCLASVVSARNDRGFRTAIRVMRRVARWRVIDFQPGSTDAGPGSFGLFSAFLSALVVEAGDRWTWSFRCPNVSVATGPPTYRTYQGDIATGSINTDATVPFPAGGSGLNYSTRWDVLAASTAWKFDRILFVPAGGHLTVPAWPPPVELWREILEREPGDGPIVEARDAAAELQYGEHTADGLRSPLARQLTLTQWASDALGWCPAPPRTVDNLRVEARPDETSGLAFIAGARTAAPVVVRWQPQIAPGFDLQAWIAGQVVTIEPGRWVDDVTVGPLTPAPAAASRAAALDVVDHPGAPPTSTTADPIPGEGVPI